MRKSTTKEQETQYNGIISLVLKTFVHPVRETFFLMTITAADLYDIGAPFTFLSKREEESHVNQQRH